MTTFVDTVGLHAILNAADSAHSRAGAEWERMLRDDEELISTSYVVLETIALVQARLGIEAVRVLATDILPLLRIEWVDANLHGDALAALLTAGRRHLSLVDCVSFETMRRLQIRRAFTFDDHFAEQGFQVIP